MNSLDSRLQDKREGSLKRMDRKRRNGFRIIVCGTSRGWRLEMQQAVQGVEFI